MAHQQHLALLRLFTAVALTWALLPGVAYADTSNDIAKEQETLSSEGQISNTSQGTNIATAGKTLRVGFANQPGTFTVDENGNYSGYEYDYLLQLAQYTGWDYEFIEATGSDLNSQILNSLEMLKSGEVDILGTMNYNATLAEQYEYPKNSYGYFHPALFAADNTTVVTKTNLYTLKEITIAVKRGAVAYQNELESFCVKNNIELIIQEYDSFEEMAAAVNDGTADALLDLDINLHEGFHLVTTFQKYPIFFSAKKGNTNITNAIDSAIDRMNTGNPSLQSNLYQTYYGAGEADLSLTPSELDYAAVHEPLRVGVLSNKAPIQSIDPKTGELTGVTKGVLDFIASNSGLRFEIVPLSYSDNFSQELRDQNIDIVSGVDLNYNAIAEWGLSLTASYVTANTLIVFNKNMDPSNLDGKIIAVPRDQVTNVASQRATSTKVYDSLDSCFEAVESGQADYVYANTYTAPYYINLGGYTNLNFLPVSISTSQACFGIVAPIEPDLLLILNKSIRSIPESTLSSMIYESSLPTQSERFTQFVKTHLLELFITSVVVLLLVIALLVLYLRTRIKSARAARDENNRHREIYRISNEQFFEYNPKSDKLLLSAPEGKQLTHLHSPSDKENTDASPYQTYDHISTQHYEFLPLELVEAITTPQSAVEDICCYTNGGQKTWVRITSSILTDEAGRAQNIIGKITDINDEILEKKDLSERAERDGLTGLLNRTTFEEAVTQLLSNGKAGAFLIADVDNFKIVNDTHGHMVGDAALRNTADLLRAAFREEDLISRFGGDEFAVCLRGEISYSNIKERCEILVTKGLSCREDDGAEYQTTLSVGVILINHPGDNYDHLYALADKALYEAKSNGRNQFVLHES